MRLPITNWWAASALGTGPAEMAANLKRGEAPGMRPISGDIPGREIFFGNVDAPLQEIHDRRWRMRTCQLLELAVREMRGELDSLIARHGADRIGIVLGASTTGIDEAENYIDQWFADGTKPEEFDFSMIALASPSVYLAQLLGTTAPAYTISTACSSAAKAFGAARRLIERGICDAVVTGGVDGRCRFAMNGFAALGALAQGRCRPLAPDRDGINLGEAVALFTLEKQQSSSSPQAFLSGIGESSDAYHATAPDPEGIGAEMAMQAALSDANLSPSQISYVNLHGTGTIANDAMELKALERVGYSADCLVESTKSMTGHCLGAAGAIEAAICLVRLAQLGAGRAAISNSFAFGGSNASVVFES